MMKSKDTIEIIKLMEANNIEAIIFGAKSDLPILNLNAVLYGAKYKVSSEKFISLLKEKLIKSEASFFGVPLSSYIVAALDVLGVEKYSGDDNLIIRLVDSNFNF